MFSVVMTQGKPRGWDLFFSPHSTDRSIHVAYSRTMARTME